MMKNVYSEIPVLKNDRFILRAIREEKDADDLLTVYSDEKAVPFFNSDGCNGDDFHYDSMERMRTAIGFWDYAYRLKCFVRWAIEDKENTVVIGTIELFNRSAGDYFSNCGLLRLDLRSDYETKDRIECILSILIPGAEELFAYDKIATKAIADAGERILALESLGFRLSEEVLIGHDGAKYDSYYVMGL
jgi:hypothetical protein